jgi:catechol 2,3-dioxygenase-like lactoylglutathione lyase family enzyme
MTQSLAHVALIVRDYDEAIAWFTGKLGFTVVADEDQPEPPLTPRYPTVVNGLLRISR